jgi:hypothetical protein
MFSAIPVSSGFDGLPGVRRSSAHPTIFQPQRGVLCGLDPANPARPHPAVESVIPVTGKFRPDSGGSRLQVDILLYERRGDGSGAPDNQIPSEQGNFRDLTGIRHSLSFIRTN